MPMNPSNPNYLSMQQYKRGPTMIPVKGRGFYMDKGERVTHLFDGEGATFKYPNLTKFVEDAKQCVLIDFNYSQMDPNIEGDVEIRLYKGETFVSPSLRSGKVSAGPDPQFSQWYTN